MATVVSIGRSLPDGRTLSDEEWISFQNDLLETVQKFTGIVYFQGVGLGVDELGMAEESFTVVGDTWFGPFDQLRELATAYGQRSIACTVGQTSLLEA